MTHLILHKVRGEPAFDIASKIACPVCEPIRQGLDHGQDYAGNCDACDDGHWWIIPTSGHRAYPYQHWPLTSLEGDVGQGYFAAVATEVPADWPDHYNVTKEGPKVEINFGQILTGLSKFKFKRRF